ncbi:MAG: glycosyltransferase, partial [Odoribacter sp.]|nr:glycosyltransferase [Odoribacter sp.]
SGVTQIGYHFNKAMLVTDVGGLGEIIADGKSGYVVKPEIAAIADAIVDFYDQGRQADFEQETMKLKEQFSWNKMTDVMMELYATINSKRES